LKLNKTSIHSEVTVVEQHRAGDAVAQQIERQLIFRIGAALVAGGEEGQPHAPRRLVANRPKSPRTGGGLAVRGERLITALTWKAPSSRAPSNTL